MAKRVKTVFDDVEHVWAHQTADHGHNKGGNFYFRGDTIYSYGSHFPIAKHVSRKGQRCVLLTTRGYSSTTAGHVCATRRAVNHLTVFNVSDINSEDRAAQLREYAANVAALMEQYHKARQRKPVILGQIRATVEEGNAFAEFWGLKRRLGNPESLDEMVAACEKIVKSNAESERRRRKQAERKAALQVEAWKAGESHFCPYTETTLLRIKGDELETSLGVSIPLDHAKRAFKFVAACREKKTTYHANGHTIHLGRYALDSIDAEGNVKAGCHHIAWPEVERVAKLAGVA